MRGKWYCSVSEWLMLNVFCWQLVCVQLEALTARIIVQLGHTSTCYLPMPLPLWRRWAQFVLSSVQQRMVTRSGKSTCTPPCQTKSPLLLALKQFQLWFDWHWLRLVFQDHEALPLSAVCCLTLARLKLVFWIPEILILTLYFFKGGGGRKNPQSSKVLLCLIWLSFSCMSF